MKLRTYLFLFIVILLGIYLFSEQNVEINENENAINEQIDSNGKENLKIANITQKRIINANDEPNLWLSHGRNYEEQRYSPLTQINKESIKDLELAWAFDMNSTRALESTPIVDDGIMFLTSEWSIVYAIDAKTGEEVWYYDPDVPKDWGRKACCDVQVN